MNRLKKLWPPSLALFVGLQLTGCAKTVQWDEEVKLNDGRVIVVTQKRRCEGGDYTAKTNASCLARETWLTIRLPEFSDKEIVWHESLNPLVVNIHQKRLYVIGLPPTSLEFRTYGASNPPYFGFVLDGDAWKRIPFTEIPEAIYGTNMLIESIPSSRTKFMTLEKKDSLEENGTLTKPAPLHRIDPKFTIAAH